MSSRSIYRFAIPAALLVALSAPCAGTAHAEDAKSSVKKQRAIQVQIKDQEEKLRQTREAEADTLDALDNINRKLHQKKQELNDFRAQMRKTEGEIRNVNDDISSLNAKIARHRQWMARKLQAMHRHGKFGDIILILGASQDASDLMKRWRYLEVLARYERGMIDDYKAAVETLAIREAELKRLGQRLSSEEETVKKSEENLAREKEQKRQILATVQQKKEAYVKMIRDLQEASEKLQKMIEDEERQKRFASKGLMGLKGQLPWPVKGTVAIPYGAQTDPKYNTPVFRNGIYIATSEGDSAKAVLGGRVDFADWFKGYGQLVIVNHGGGYHSLYANLSEIFLKEGDIIEDGTNVGRVGDSSVIDRPSLYFEIRYKGKPLDPAQWLKK